MVSCGDSSSTPGGGGGPAGGGGSGGGTSGGACNYPPCLTNFAAAVEDCEPSGTCVMQSGLPTGGSTSFSTNICYSNGVKQIASTTMDALTGSVAMAITVKKGSSTCYSMDVSGISFADPTTGQVTMTFKDASGSTVATGTMNLGTNAMTVTCPGGQPVTLDPSCDTSSYAAGMNPTSSACTQGTCTP